MKLLWFIGILVVSMWACKPSNTEFNCEFPEERDKYPHANKYGYKAYTNVQRARKCAKASGKPLLIMFTGWTTSSFPGLSWRILQDPEVKKLVEEHYVLVALYVDDKSPLYENHSSTNTWKGKVAKTIGEKNHFFQLNQFQTNTQPWYIAVDHNLNALNEGIGYLPSEEKHKFIDFLLQGLPH